MRMKKFIYDPVEYQNHNDAERANKDLAGAVHVETYIKSEPGCREDKTIVVFAFYPDEENHSVSFNKTEKINKNNFIELKNEVYYLALYHDKLLIVQFAGGSIFFMGDDSFLTLEEFNKDKGEILHKINFDKIIVEAFKEIKL